MASLFFGVLRIGRQFCSDLLSVTGSSSIWSDMAVVFGLGGVYFAHLHVALYLGCLPLGTLDELNGTVADDLPEHSTSPLDSWRTVPAPGAQNCSQTRNKSPTTSPFQFRQHSTDAC